MVNVNNNDVVCISNEGKIIYSTDTGLNWDIKDFGQSFIFTNIHIFNDDIFITTTDNRIFKTSIDRLTSLESKAELDIVPQKIYLNKIYPNPAQNFVNIDIIFSKEFSFSDFQLNLYDNSGKLIPNSLNFEIISTSVNSGIFQITFTNAFRGVYFIEFSVHDERKFFPIVIGN